jgi:N6-adenosine-specific RNA methylase IME4/ParB-like chromosome segregation protein Spo0J
MMSDVVKVGGQTFTILFPDLLRQLTDGERSGLRADIEARGEVVVPVVVDERLGVIDGGNRLTIAGELGFNDVPIELRPGLSLDEKRALALALNEHRRHLSQGEKRDLIARRLKSSPEKSNNSIAEDVGVDDKTVGAVRSEMESRSEIPNVAVRVDTKGRQQPASKSRPAKVRAESARDAASAADLLDEADCHQDGPTDVAGLRRKARDAGKARTVNGIASASGKCKETDLAVMIGRGQKFGTIYADPPWKYGNQKTRASTDNHYPTMTVDEISALPVKDLAADQAHLHLWTTNAFLFESQKIMAAWGFEYKSVFVWVKPQMGIGNYWRVSHEFLLLGVRGGLGFADHGQMSWVEKDRTGHSVKPREVRERVEKVSPGPRLELFGRVQVDGWTVWGNQIGSDMFDTEATE